MRCEKCYLCGNKIINAMKTTLYDIAKKTGYSLTTISRVLNGKSEEYRISQEATDLIVAEARRCNYIIKSNAQILRQANSKTIGIMLPSVSNPFFAELAAVIVDEVKRRGYNAIVSVTNESEVDQESCLSSLMARDVEGVIAAPCGSNQNLFYSVNRDMAPVVLVDRFFIDSNISYISSNNMGGALDATRYLINKGHKRIVCIQGDQNLITNRKRVEGYRKAMTEAGLEDNISVVGDSFSVQNGYFETKMIVGNRSSLPDAIFALSYTTALGVMKALKESNLTAGKDISLISFDDNMSLDYMQPEITRVAQAVDEMGKFAVKVLFEQIENPQTVSQIELNTKIIYGDSVAEL